MIYLVRCGVCYMNTILYTSYETITIQIDQLYVWVQCTDAHKDHDKKIFKHQKLRVEKRSERNEQEKSERKNSTIIILLSYYWIKSSVWSLCVLSQRYLYVLKKKKKKIKSVYEQPNIGSERLKFELFIELKILIKIYIHIHIIIYCQSSAYLDTRCAVHCSIWHTEMVI